MLHAFGFVPMHMFAAFGRVSGGRDFISGPKYGSVLCVFDEISEYAEEAGRQHFCVYDSPGLRKFFMAKKQHIR